MTTIVYDHESKVIAWDSRRTAGSLIISDSVEKMIEVGELKFWLTGAVPDIDELVKRYTGESDKTSEIDCGGFVFAGELRSIGFNDGELWTCDVVSSESTGTGESFALAALDFGKSAIEAVEYAKTRDIYTGGEVKQFHLNNSDEV